MSELLPDMAEALDRDWHARTGGRLALAIDGKPLSTLGAAVPSPVRKALERRRGLAAHRKSGRIWWVTPPPGSARSLQIVAWTDEEAEWGEVLQTWAGLLGGYFEQRETAQGLTDALISSWDRLAFLYDLARIAGSQSDLPDMLLEIVHLLSQVQPVDDVFLVAETRLGWLALTASGRPLASPSALVQCVRGARRPKTLEEVRDVLTAAASPLADAGDLLLSPLTGERGPGVIGLIDPAGRKFDANDVQLLASVAEQVNALIEAAETRDARQTAQRLEHELSIAAGIQASLLPERLPGTQDYEMAALLKPARHVGGDCYDAVVTESGAAMLLLADVAGKGIPAALLTALTHAMFRSESTHRTDPAEILRVMNRSLYSDLDRAQMFITAVVARIDAAPLGITYASAGHVDLVLWRAAEQRVELLPATGLPLGVNPADGYSARSVPLAPGDVALLYSDGVTEAEGPPGSLFGVQGLLDIMWAAHPAGAQDQARAILEALDVHRAERPLKDDVAVLLVRALPAERSAGEIVPFVIPAQLQAVRGLVEQVRERCERGAGRNADAHRQSVEFALAVCEIVANQIQHALGGRGWVYGRLSLGVGRFQADLFDNGEAFTAPAGLDAPVDPLDPPERGYGLRLARGLLDELHYSRLESGRNHWCLVKLTEGVWIP